MKPKNATKKKIFNYPKTSKLKNLIKKVRSSTLTHLSALCACSCRINSYEFRVKVWSKSDGDSLDFVVVDGDFVSSLVKIGSVIAQILLLVFYCCSYCYCWWWGWSCCWSRNLPVKGPAALPHLQWRNCCTSSYQWWCYTAGVKNFQPSV